MRATDDATQPERLPAYPTRREFLSALLIGSTAGVAGFAALMSTGCDVVDRVLGTGRTAGVALPPDGSNPATSTVTTETSNPTTGSIPADESSDVVPPTDADTTRTAGVPLYEPQQDVPRP
jgi:hypothetical protein